MQACRHTKPRSSAHACSAACAPTSQQEAHDTNAHTPVNASTLRNPSSVARMESCVRKNFHARTCGFIRLRVSALSSSFPSEPIPTAAPSVLACTLAFARTVSTSFSLSGSTLTTTWCTVCGTVSRPLRSTHVGRSQILWANLAISGEWRVAEKKHTCCVAMIFLVIGEWE